MNAEDDFPFGGTLDGGRYQIVEHYLGGGTDQLWFARNPAEPNARYLVSTTIDNGFILASDGPPLMRPARGLFTPRFVGVFDTIGDGSVLDCERRSTLAYVEQVPSGRPLAGVAADLLARHAWRLGAQVAEKLLAAAAGAVLDIGLRPEYVWIEMRGEVPEVTGIGGRNRDFFGAAMRHRDLRTVPLYTRRYVAPEVNRGERHDDRALVLTVAVMTAEWLLGRYPYEDDGAYGYWALCRGDHLELPASARELVPALSPDATVRPPLASFARTLSRLAE